MTDLVRFIGWLDLLDIGIVSVILYRLLVMLKGTRAVQMLLGLLLLVVASIVARIIPLYTLDWTLQAFWGYIVIALIVLFQPEIRRTLAEIGTASLFKYMGSVQEVKGLEEVVRATVQLAQKQIGALIVIQREMGLEEVTEFGVPLGARVSKELLMSIFHPTSPMHDGAVIISGNRIVAAGCFLPISLTPSISKSLGTRHRAALGLTEESDAVVIVVSEETGIISISMGGRLDTHLEMSSLRDKLTEIFSSKPGEASKGGTAR